MCGRSRSSSPVDLASTDSWTRRVRTGPEHLDHGHPKSPGRAKVVNPNRLLASLRRRSIRTLTWPERRCLPRAEARIVGHPCRCQHRTMHERLIASREKRQVCMQVSHPGRACDTERAEFGQRDRPHAQLHDPWILQPMPAVGGAPHGEVQTVEFSAGHAAREKNRPSFEHDVAPIDTMRSTGSPERARSAVPRCRFGNTFVGAGVHYWRKSKR